MKVIEVIKQVEFSYPKDDKYIYCIPEDLEILPSKTYSIVGISGSGKSTILTLLAALRRFSKGLIQYTFKTNTGSQKLKVTADNWTKIIGPQFWGNIGFSFQNPEMLRALTVKNNLELILGKAKTEEMVLALFNKKEWNDIKNSRVWKLSGGQKQRLGVIRSFGVSNQNIVFMDEPTNNLDKSNRKKLINFIHKYQDNKSLIVVSHDKAFTDMLNIETTFEIREKKQANGQLQRILEYRDF